MIKKDKKLYITVILMFIIVAALIIVAWVYIEKNGDYKNMIDATNKSLNSMTLSYEDLQEEVERLEEENKTLKERENMFFSENSDLTTYRQSLIDLSDISLMIKEGNKEGAKKELLKIDTNGFDLTALAFYESLCRELNITTN